MRLNMSINLTDIVKAVAEDQSLSQTAAKSTIDSFIETIIAMSKEGKKISIYGFGNFEVKERAARVGKNPRTGEEIQVSACKVVKFKPAKNFKDEING